MVYYQNGKCVFRSSVAGDVERLAPELRDGDRKEILAMGQTSLEALEYSFSHSTIAVTIEYNGVIAGMFGIIPVSLMGQLAVIWLLTSPEIEKMKVTFAKICRPFFDFFLKRYPVLVNPWVDSRYFKSIEWLKWCGAEIGPSNFHGVNGEVFVKVVITRNKEGL